MQLSEHFTIAELVQSQTAARLGLDNTPPPEAVEHLRHLCETILEPARQALGALHISSGYRAPAVNAAVGGAKDSAHMFGHAADVIPLQAGKLAFARWVQTSVPYDQVICEYGALPPGDPAWIHVSSAPSLRGETLAIIADGLGYRPVKL